MDNEKEKIIVKEIIEKDFQKIENPINDCDVKETMIGISRVSSDITAFSDEGIIGAYDYEDYNTIISENIKKFHKNCSCSKK